MRPAKLIIIGLLLIVLANVLDALAVRYVLCQSPVTGEQAVFPERCPQGWIYIQEAY